MEGERAQSGEDSEESARMECRLISGIAREWGAFDSVVWVTGISRKAPAVDSLTLWVSEDRGARGGEPREPEKRCVAERLTGR